MGAVLAALEQLLLPNACVACDRLAAASDAGGLVCSRCRARLTVLTGGCPRCHQPMPLIGGCRFCRTWPVELEWARSGVWLGREAREIVHHLKYDGYTALAGFMADIVARAVPAPAAGTLVPIPLTPSRLKRRGFNQAGLLARALGAKWGLPVGEHLLIRPRESGSQTALTPGERMANVREAFSARPSHHAGEGAEAARGAMTHGGVRGLSAAAAGERGGGEVVIVDDVLTTGATLSAAATALTSVGWRRLGAVTFARALPYERRVM